VLPQRPAALPGGMRQMSLARLAVQPGGPGVHDPGLGGRVHRALFSGIGIVAGMKMSVPALCYCAVEA
jgi:hypothetical protein